MEAGLIIRVECQNSSQRDFVRLMLSDTDDRPLFEDDAEEAQRKWFAALEDVATAENTNSKGDSTLYATFTIGGIEWEEDVRDTLQCFKNCDIRDVYAVVAGDEDWYELWIVSDGQLARHESWKGKSVGTLFEGKGNLMPVLDKIRSANLDM